jgi:polysaccharide export outer membrane protein
MRASILVFTASLLAIVAASSLAQEQGQIISQAGASYTLGPGDIIRIIVWGRDELSGQFQVDEEGKIQYPLLGEIDLADLSVAEVRDSIRAGLGQLFTTPFVTITPLFRIAVLGEVRNPGLYTVDPTLSVLDLVALAGGNTASGNLNKIRVFRSAGETEVSFEEASLRGRTLQEIGVRSGDEVVVPRKFFTRGDWQIVLQLVQIGLTVAIFASTVGK